MEMFPYVELKNLVTQKEDKSAKGAANGYAPLDSGAKVPFAQLPTSITQLAATAELKTNKGAANGYPSLDNNKRIPLTQLPESVASIPATLDWVVSDGLPYLQSLLDAKADTTQAVPVGGADGQVLAKASATDNDVEWIDPPESGGGGGTPFPADAYRTVHRGGAPGFLWPARPEGDNPIIWVDASDAPAVDPPEFVDGDLIVDPAWNSGVPGPPGPQGPPGDSQIYMHTMWDPADFGEGWEAYLYLVRTGNIVTLVAQGWATEGVATPVITDKIPMGYRNPLQAFASAFLLDEMTGTLADTTLVTVGENTLRFPFEENPAGMYYTATMVYVTVDDPPESDAIGPGTLSLD